MKTEKALSSEFFTTRRHTRHISSWCERGGDGERGGYQRIGMFVVSFRGKNNAFWHHLRCLSRNFNNF